MKSAALWQLSVTVARPAEEAVEALLEHLFGQPPVIYAAEDNPISVVTVYSPGQREELLAKRDAIRGELGGLARDGVELGPVKVELRKVPAEDWSESWKKHFKPLVIGSALLVVPSWSKRKARKGQATVILDPGLSFGTGQHPTTAFCLSQLVAARKSGQSQSFLDIGTGSGILAIAAVKLGYGPVRAIDFDPAAVRVAKENVVQNGVRGALRILRQDLTRAPLRERVCYDVICANLLDDLLVRERRRIVGRLAPGGRLVLAGILAHQFAGVQRAYEGLGLQLVRARTEAGWRSGAFRRTR